MIFLTGAEYLVSALHRYEVSDVFGIPGGVVLDFLYALNDSCSVVPHLLYNEQSAAFAACGYAQRKNNLACAYATRGPGIANMITAIAEAWQESLPVLFITAHKNCNTESTRMDFDQELNFVKCISNFIKYAKTVDSVDEFPLIIEDACRIAVSGRKGPVFLDFSAELFKSNILQLNFLNKKIDGVDNTEINNEIFLNVYNLLSNAKRPLFLIGDGVRKSGNQEYICKYLSQTCIPVISSRGAQDCMSGYDNYFGYIGSHGIRHANFILSKADLIIALGNRLSFPIKSQSFLPVFQNSKVVRIDIDKSEFHRILPNTYNCCIDAWKFLQKLDIQNISLNTDSNWLSTCKQIRNLLIDMDLSLPSKSIIEILKLLRKRKCTYVCDVGNNEFFFSSAFQRIQPCGCVLYSRSFGTLGVAIGRAIGAYYAEKKNITICVIGDYGFQYNIQELQYITQFRLPIKIILMNNYSSGMIKDHEESLQKYPLHVSEENGYTVPSFKKIVESYGISFLSFSNDYNNLENALINDEPYVIEISYDSNIKLTPYLPRGRMCYDMLPSLDENLFTQLKAF